MVLEVLESQSKAKRVAVLVDSMILRSTHAFSMEEGFISELSGRLMSWTNVVHSSKLSKRLIILKTLKELRENIPDYMTEWDYEPPNSRAYAKLGLMDDYQWVFQSRMKSRKEWHEKQQLRKQLNEDFEA